ncbi:hypothetical protein QWZ16_04585 [Vibrio ostreicida]|uniref:Uncharacterized protein n=1 Tax=Vibrio ostreicida TaxID=526588 RepID=A0ABT8BPF9_9VIBR|nr:hypothetical protein [Vibrio ostreicida]MDN3609000.1 hypothetical protein [Vibrio ostreicida]
MAAFSFLHYEAERCRLLIRHTNLSRLTGVIHSIPAFIRMALMCN